MKDHEIRVLVNELTEVARTYSHTQQLREQIARVVKSRIKKNPQEREPNLRGAVEPRQCSSKKLSRTVK